jgi:hypothetical protein
MEKNHEVYEQSYNKVISNIYVKLFLVFITLIAATLTILMFFQEKKANLQFEIISNTNVLDINTEISKLDILYDATSLKSRNENLKIISIKVSNIGSRTILIDYYDNNDPLGLRIDSGIILENPEIIETSNEYIKRNLQYILPNSNTITFSKIIIESKEYFIFKILVLHNMNKNPQLHPMGKIAGQKSIKIKQLTDTRKNENLLYIAFAGNFFIQLIRFILYSIIFVLIIILIVTTSEKISYKLRLKKKERLVKKFKKSNNYEYRRMDDAIFDRYIKSGFNVIDEIDYQIEDMKLLNQKYKNIIEDIKIGNKPKPKSTKNRSMEDLKLFMDDWELINILITDGIVLKENSKLVINQMVKNTLTQFIEFLKQENAFDTFRLPIADDDEQDE